MYHSPIALPQEYEPRQPGPVGFAWPDPVGDRIGEEVARGLAELAAALDVRFLEAGTKLGTAVDTIGRVVAALDAITGALDQSSAAAAIHDLTVIADRLGALPGEQAARAAELATIGAASATLRADVMEMHECLHVLKIYGKNIKITAAAEPAFVGFVDGMATKLEFGSRLLDGVLARLNDLAAGVASVGQTGRLLANECAAVVPHVPRKLAKDAAALDGYLRSLAEVARDVSEIARAMQVAVGIALGTLQVGDSTRQRLEHVVSALQILETIVAQAGGEDAVDPTVCGLVRELLGAQLEATAKTFGEEAMRLVAALRDLGPEAVRLLGLIEQQGGGEGRNFLAQLERGIGEVAPVTIQLGRAEERSRTMIGVVSTTVDDLTGRLQQIQRVRLDVQDIATNTRLLCRRHGNIGRAVSVIAAEIDVQANMLGTAMKDVLRPIETLSSVNRSMQDAQAAEGIDIDQKLSGALAIIRQGCLQTEHAIGSGGDDARQLIVLLEGAVDELAAQLALTDQVHAAAGVLRAAAAPGEPTEEGAAMLHELLPRIAALYTMAPEREVHARTLPAAFAPPPVVATVEEDDDDDGLF